MKFKSIKGYVYVIVSGVFLYAAIHLFIANVGVELGKPISFYWTQLDNVTIGMLMLVSAGAGVVLMWMLQLFWAGAKAIRTGRMESKADELDRIRKAKVKADKQQAKADPPAAGG